MQRTQLKIRWKPSFTTSHEKVEQLVEVMKHRLAGRAVEDMLFQDLAIVSLQPDGLETALRCIEQQ
jgi:hypothetical protein